MKTARRILSDLLLRMRMAKKIISVYFRWRPTFTGLSSLMGGSYGFLVLAGTNGPNLRFVELDSQSTKFLLSGTGAEAELLLIGLTVTLPEGTILPFIVSKGT